MNSLGHSSVTLVIKAVRVAYTRLWPVTRFHKETGFTFFFIGLFFSFLIIGTTYYTAWTLDIGRNPMYTNFIAFMYDAVYRMGYPMALDVLVLSIGLYAATFNYNDPNNFSPTSFRTSLGRIDNDTWFVFALSLTVLMVMHLALFQWNFNYYQTGYGMLGSWTGEMTLEKSKVQQLLDWSKSLIMGLSQFVPYLLAMRIANDRTARGLKVGRSIIPAVKATLITALVINSFVGTAWQILNDHLFPLVLIPFAGSFIPMVFMTVSIGLIGGLALPFLAICIQTPYREVLAAHSSLDDQTVSCR